MLAALGQMPGAPPTSARNKDGAPSALRVKIGDMLTPLEVRGFDLRIEEGNRLATVADRLTQWEVRCGRGRVRLLPTRERVGVRLASTRALSPLLLDGPVRISTPAGFLSFDSQPYRGALIVYPGPDNACEVVNELDVEKYLDGLVNAEFNANWKEASIAAQVIAARTYAIHQQRWARAHGKHYDLDSTEKDQVYNGAVREDFRASRTVDLTRGVVLVAGNDSEPIKAFYHSTCGGRTELPEHVWGKPYPGFKHTVLCNFCETSPRFRWELDLAESDIVDELVAGARADASWSPAARRLMEGRRLLDLRMVRDDPDGRVTSILTVWSDGAKAIDVRIPTAKFRQWLGAARFKSTDFTAVDHRRIFRKYWKFEGRGNGHGVGMCQWGAKVMGERGYTANAILKFYYPDARLARLW